MGGMEGAICWAMRGGTELGVGKAAFLLQMVWVSVRRMRTYSLVSLEMGAYLGRLMYSLNLLLV
jgi:hypothetical protein